MFGADKIFEFFNWIANLFPGAIYVFVILIFVICLIGILALRPRVIKNVKKTVDEINDKDFLDKDE